MDLFKNAPADRDLALFLATDLDENVRFTVNPNLKNVRVTIFALKNDPNPEVMKRKRAKWEKFFAEGDAKEVNFITEEVIR